MKDLLPDEYGPLRLELQQFVHVTLAAKLEVGGHEVAGNAAPVVSCGRGI